MLINRSSKYNAMGEFWHDGRKVAFNRVWGGLGFHGTAKFAVVLGEEQFFNETHYYVLVEAQTEKSESLVHIFEAATFLEATYKVSRWVGRVDANIQQVLAVYNKKLYNSGIRNLVIMDVPRIGEEIDESISLVHSLVKKEEKRLHFFSESMIPSEIQGLPSRDIKQELYPRATALANVVGGLLLYSHDAVDQSALEPEVEAPY